MEGGGEKRNRKTKKDEKKLAWANGSTKCSTKIKQYAQNLDAGDAKGHSPVMNLVV